MARRWITFLGPVMDSFSLYQFEGVVLVAKNSEAVGKSLIFGKKRHSSGGTPLEKKGQDDELTRLWCTPLRYSEIGF